MGAPPRESEDISFLQHRIKVLEQRLSERPTKEQVDYVLEYAKRQKALHEASLARCVILKKKLDALKEPA